jgi:hypothetical protein
MKKLNLSLFFVFALLLAKAQFNDQPRVENVNLEFLKTTGNILITYDLVNPNPELDYFVTFQAFYAADHKPVKAVNFSGDISRVSAGTKQIVWNLAADGLAFDHDIYVKVLAKGIYRPMVVRAIGKSLVFPGWGHYEGGKNRPYWLHSVLGYSALAGSGYFAWQSQSYHDKYKSASNSKDASNFLDQANKNKLFTVGCLVTAATVWTVNTYISGKKAIQAKNRTTDEIWDLNVPVISNTSETKHISTFTAPPSLSAELDFRDANGNSILEANEKAELAIKITNLGKGAARQLKVNVSDSISDYYLTLADNNQEIAVLKPLESKTIRLKYDAAKDIKGHKHKLKVTVSEFFGYDMDPVYLYFNTYPYQPAKLVYSGLEIDDSGEGTLALTEDGQLQPGEMAKLKIVVQNTGADLAKNIQFKLACRDEQNVKLTDQQGMIGDILPGETKEIVTTISPNKKVSTKSLYLNLLLAENTGQSLLNQEISLPLNQKMPKPNIVVMNENLEALRKEFFVVNNSKVKSNFGQIVNLQNITASKTKRKHSVAVLFGVERYSNFAQAPFAENDAQIISTYFSKMLGVDQVITYLSKDATGFIFDKVFDPETGELQKAIVRDSSEVFVFYSGHGIPDKTGDNVYLVPSDAQLAMLEKQGFNVEKLYDNLNKMGAKHTTVILDACFSGASRSTSEMVAANLTGNKGIKIKPKKPWINNPRFTFINSSTGDETSLGFKESQTGLFTYFFCAGLQGNADENKDRKITLGELSKYVIQNVMETSKKIYGLQTPEFFGNNHDILVEY